VSWSNSDSRIIGGMTFKRLLEADIVFNDGMDCFLANSSNLAEVMCHELGHAIGLDHSSDSTALMYALAQGRGRDANLGTDDRNGVLAIYPSSGGGGGGGGAVINDAASVTQSAPSEMIAGRSYSVSVTMRNSGTSTWSPGGYRLGSDNPAGNLNWGINRVDLPFSVSPGSSATFSFSVIAPATAGRYSFQWRMLQEGVGYFGTPSTNLSVEVAASGGEGGPVSITTLNLPDAVRGRSYSQTLKASGGTPPYRWSVVGGIFPPGLSLSQGGAITGTPTAAGSYNFSLEVVDSTGGFNNRDSRRITLTVVEPSGSPGASLAITRVKVKGTKKLYVYGHNFSAQSIIVLNGRAVTPKTFTQEEGAHRLFYKGKLRLGAPGTNVVIVINGGNQTSPFIF
ncbi:MAG TPA: putative Ig domain-containing protein, partial [Blastocatellia bacterium]|nr:putative Ig domain-containing protein [Blastocatellia bacterium]